MTAPGAEPGFVHADALLPGVVSTAVGYRADAAEPRLHRGVPSPYLTFIFSLDDPIVTAAAPEQLGTPAEHRTAIITGGLHTTPAYIAMPRHQAGIQLAVHPLAARALFGATTAELGFPVTDGAALLGAEAEALRQRLVETAGWERRFALLADYLRRRMGRARPSSAVRPELLEAWRWLHRSGGRRPLDELTGHVALSGRQLSTLFDRELGLGPKGVGRLVRFSTALRLITRTVSDGRPPELAGVAARCGYYDQSHLVRDFRGYVGISPTGWLAEERASIVAGGHRNGEV